MFEQLIEEVVSSNLYPQLIQQLQKDIHRAGIEHTIGDQLNPKELFLNIENLLFEKLNNAFNEYLNLLYAVDVSEKAVRNFQSEDSLDISQYTTYLILKREWQKIYYRNKL
ncbi:hypothetical protein [Aquimarina sp. 2201CG14-23]|uniref:hypothetical protein n=1 Tax=Aquimarina mycalae TaxID=3040073 RepID=UPI002477E020|nr:hypothetical protein [Aquimarina sp. 2201CG14-23]MDH7445502.1 hypothetical protein [Aquimarina sp. 2201CG14-23]